MRVQQAIEVGGTSCWTRFDTDARNTYVVPSVARRLITSPTLQTFRTALGETNTAAILDARVEGHLISTHAFVIDEIGGDENGTPIEILFGALAMQEWGIRLIPDEERLDLSHYPDKFVEFWQALRPACGEKVARSAG